jgi:two-component system NtrC family response regulator
MVVEDDPGLQRQMRWALADAFDVHVAKNRDEALSTLAEAQPRLVVLDLGLPPDPNGASEGLSILDTILTERPGTKVIVASGNEDRRNALKAISLGAYDFFPKPVDVDQLRLILERAWRLHELEDENRRLAQTVGGEIEGLISASSQMTAVARTVERVAPTDVSVLILGESGTGKELIARALHTHSHRIDGPFIAVNCAAIPENLLESELFGYEKGAFTGAIKQTHGKVEQARGGTLFLDEIGDMPLSLQAKMLRFLQNRSIQRLGGHEEIPVDVRFVAASNRDIGNMIQSGGGFREDLYFRVNEVAIQLPPLRERDGDAVLIATALVQRFSEAYKRPNLSFAPEATLAIANYAWPGNVRELENRVKRAVVLARDKLITAADLGLGAETASDPLITLKEARQKAELEAIRRAMAACGNNQSHAARVLGVSRQTLYNLILSYGLKVESN